MIEFCTIAAETDSPEMADIIVPEYSKREIVEAGKVLKGKLSDVDDEALRVFRIAHNWRAAHLRPMNRVRGELGRAVKQARSEGIAYARLKRMKSIRKKLRTTDYTLYQMQDIAGCRALMDSIAQVNALISLYKNGFSKHAVTHEFDYIAGPRDSGYRSYHLLLKFSGYGEDEVFNRQRVEIQIRTTLQHAWATAVEAVGAVLGEDLKGGEGNPDWLRLFAIMSAEFAAEERQPGTPGISERPEDRRQELLGLNDKLKAVRNLEIWNAAIRGTDQIAASQSRFYLIQYDNATKYVSVRPTSQGAALLAQEEQANATRDTVLVEVEKAEDLKEAYPNYFLDIGVFANRLRAVLSGEKPPPLMRHKAPKVTPFIDLSWWLRRG